MINLNGTTTGYGANTAELANTDIRIGNGAAPTNGIYSPGANQLALSTAGTGRLFVDASGKVGIGTSSPSSRLHVSGTTAEAWVSDGTNTIVTGGWDGSTQYIKSLNIGTAFTPLTHQATAHIFRGASSEYARIDSIGRLLVGTSAARTNLTFGGTGIAPLCQIESTGSDSCFSIIRNATNNLSNARLVLAKNNSASSGTNVLVDSGEVLGEISFSGNDGTNFISGAVITAEVDGTPGTNDMPGRLVFSTTADGASSPTEAMRINNQRELLIGTTTRTANGGVLQISNGITFPGTQSACSDPNTLDDYEQGTFTPTIRGTGTTGVGTYTSQTGRYTKIGNRVYYTVYLLWTAHTGTADMRIASLPFNSSSVSQSFCAVSLLHQNIAMTAGNTMQANVLVGLAEISLSQVPTGGGAYSNVPLDTAGEIMASGFYEV